MERLSYVYFITTSKNKRKSLGKYINIVVMEDH